MLFINPELQRALWLELSIQRVVAMPVVLLLGTWAFAAAFEGRFLDYFAHFVMGIILIVWGARRAGDAVLNEVINHTWDSQRMSSIGPSAMTLGKLLGATIYVWYAIACFVPIAIFWCDVPPGLVARMLATGLLVQAVALFFSLLTHRMNPHGANLQQPMAQSMGIVAGLPFLALHATPAWMTGLVGGNRTFDLYDISLRLLDFVLIVQLVLVFWAIVGVQRLLRVELQFRNMPWVWLGFLISVAVIVAGLDLDYVAPSTGVPLLFGDLVRVFGAFTILAGLTFVAAFFEPKSVVRLRAFLTALAARRWRDGLRAVPTWGVAMLVTLLLGIIASVQWIGYVLDPLVEVTSVHDAMNYLPLSPFLALATMLFVTRDIGILYLLTLDPRHRRGHLTAMIFIGIAYAVLPAVMSELGQDQLIAWFIPDGTVGPVSAVLPVLVQAVLAWGAVIYRHGANLRTDPALA